MLRAIEEMAKCELNGPRVGAVIARGNTEVAAGHRRQGAHAERVAIESALASGADLHGTTIYSTLEPCVEVHSSTECCADLVARVGISTVYIGRYDAHPNIHRAGWKRLREQGLLVRDFPASLREKIDVLNSEFVEKFEIGVGPKGGARFDYTRNNGDFDIRYSESDDRLIRTRWTIGGTGCIWAYAVHPVRVALARYAREFEEIDDPRAYDFRNHSVSVNVGDIAIFVDDAMAALVKVLDVQSGPFYGSNIFSVKIRYELRTSEST
jgi:diaminohydroxyphosphoribosylaminopyrimidine deaminase/5-amino-6-(5-phosphoribosylamino)uracil reductase